MSNRLTAEERLAEKSTLLYTIRLPRNIALMYEEHALNAGCSATKAVTEGAIRGAFTMPSASSEPIE